MAAVKVIKYPPGHFHAICYDCDFSESATHSDDIDRVRRLIVAHVKEKGHRITVETAYSTIYEPA